MPTLASGGMLWRVAARSWSAFRSSEDSSTIHTRATARRADRIPLDFLRIWAVPISAPLSSVADQVVDAFRCSAVLASSLHRSGRAATWFPVDPVAQRLVVGGFGLVTPWEFAPFLASCREFPLRFCWEVSAQPMGIRHRLVPRDALNRMVARTVGIVCRIEAPVPHSSLHVPESETGRDSPRDAVPHSGMLRHPFRICHPQL